MFDYYATVEERRAGFAKLFDRIVEGETGRDDRAAVSRWPMRRDAHRALEARKTTGSTVLVP